MRNLILALAATAAFGATSVTVEAMPALGSAGLVAPGSSVEAGRDIVKTAVVVIKRRPAPRKVCVTHRGPGGAMVKRCTMR